MPDNTPFFIIGAGRSGTTLLRLILAGHSRLHIPPETWFIRPLVHQFSITEILLPSEVERAVAVMTNDYRWPDMGISAEDLRSWAAALDSPKLVDVINLVSRRQLEVYGKQRWGDKTPDYFDIVPDIAMLYSGAKFIHLIRDGRDVAISHIDVGWQRYYDRHRFPWSRAMNFRKRYKESPYAGQIHEVRYEDLVGDLEPTVRKICEFMGEKFEPAMIDWQGSLGLVPSRERRVHGKLGRPASSDDIGVWRRKLSTLECFAMEACLHRHLRELGYPLRFKGPAWRPALAACGWMLFLAAPLLKRGIPALQRRNYLRKRIYI